MSDFRRILVPDPRCASPEAASFLAQLDDQLRLLTKDTRGLTPEDLAWQPAPGMNTIGMLLAHLAIVEVHWMQVGVHGVLSDVQPVIGIGLDDDGMPIAEGAAPPETLAGRDLAYYDDLLARARVYVAGVLATLSSSDLDRQVDRTRRDGVLETVNVRWVLYHVLEHFAGHYGQVLLLKHQRRAALASASAAAVETGA
jgi:uncharacterized damage-inducible protein DinB